jgi:hypothetical protein
VGARVWRELQTRGERAATVGAFWLAVVPVAVLVPVIMFWGGADPSWVVLSVTVTLAVALLAAAWLPLMVTALKQARASAPREITRKANRAMLLVFASAVAMVTLIVTGAYVDFMGWLNERVTAELKDVQMSRQAALAITLVLLDPLVAVVLVKVLRDALNPKRILWQRVRAVAFAAGCSSLVPVSVWLWASVPAGEIDGAPSLGAVVVPRVLRRVGRFLRPRVLLRASRAAGLTQLASPPAEHDRQDADA